MKLIFATALAPPVASRVLAPYLDSMRKGAVEFHRLAPHRASPNHLPTRAWFAAIMAPIYAELGVSAEIIQRMKKRR